MTKQTAKILKPWVIEIADNLFSDAELEDLYINVHTPAAYSFIGRSNPDDSFGFWLAKLDADILHGVPAFKNLWETIEENFTHGDYRIYQLIINANTYGDCTTVHTDIPPDKDDPDGYYTILCYANNEWDPDWAGETALYNKERNDIIKSIYPRPGRIAIFDSRIPHASRAVSRLCTVVRYTIAIKIVKKTSE